MTQAVNIVHINEAGEIQQYGSCGEDQVEYQVVEGCQVHVVDRQVSLDHDYWDGTQLQTKSHFTIDTIPVPCVVEIEGVEYQCNEQPEFTFDTIGTYQITVDAGKAYYRETFEYDHQP